jgi:hypothetical protein
MYCWLDGNRSIARMGKSNQQKSFRPGFVSKQDASRGNVQSVKHKAKNFGKGMDQKSMKQRESDDRKEILRNKIEMKRLLTQMNKCKDIVEGNIPPPPPPKIGNLDI